MTPAGLYLHVPFCRQKCPYCDFYSIAAKGLENSFCSALSREIQRIDAGGLCFDTLYMGGGTPSVLACAHLGDIVSRVLDTFSFLPAPEITIEVNPGTVTAEDLRAYAAFGINRLNIGVQSFDDAELTFLGRVHSSQSALASIHMARSAGFDNLGLDLIYGLPGQTASSWVDTLARAVDLMPEHLSCYMLTFEPGTPMTRARDAGRFKILSDRRSADLYRSTVGYLADHGYAQYEISNFARHHGDGSRDYRSRHNRKYWNHTPYVGLGPSAHSFIPPRRSWNPPTLSGYLQALERGGSMVYGQEALTGLQQLTEAIFLGLRMVEGIDIQRLKRRFNTDFHQTFAAVLPDLSRHALIRMDDSHCRLTTEGMLVADAVARMLIGELGEDVETELS